MIVKHETDSTIKELSEQDLINFIDQSMKVIRNSIEILNTLQQAEDEEIDEDDELEILEDCTAGDLESILLFKSACSSVYNSINFYLNEIYEVIVNNNHNIEEIADSGVYITEEWARVLKKENERIVGGLCYILWYEFKVDEYFETAPNIDCKIDQVIKGYYDANNIPVETGMNELCKLKNTYKFKLLVFDEFPEKEDMFIQLMGPYLGGIEQSQLTIELVDSIIDGKIMPQELCELIGRDNSDLLE